MPVRGRRRTRAGRFSVRTASSSSRRRTMSTGALDGALAYRLSARRPMARRPSFGPGDGRGGDGEFESRRVARSYVGEARRRGLGSRRERIGPIIERLATRARGRHHRAQVRERRRALDLRDAVCPDDGRERQPRDRAAVRKYRASRGLSRRPGRGARARRLHDRLLPAEDEVDPRCDARPARGVRREGATAPRRAAAPARASRARPPTSSPQSSATRRGSWSTRTSGGSRSGSG